ncbi:uncharacterized protein [Cherax quadricarinatus]|uniref:uncharacterized protein n=1 Tax=Cherax quadricarinatus TaxID=27406 RepID=UPI00387E9170
MVGQVVEQVGVMVSQVVQHHLTSCHLVLITTTQHSLITANIIRRLSESVEAGVLVEVGWKYSQDQLVQDQLQQGVWGDSKTTCRGLILDFTNTNNTHAVLRFLEKAELWKLPETLVIVVGRRTEVKDVLLHHSFHNTVHVLYLALHDLTLHDLTLHELTLDDLTVHSITLNDRVWVYRKCLYCNRGEADIQLLHLWNLTSFTQIKDDLFQEQFHNFWGKNLKMSTVLYFPFMDYTLENSEPGSTVSLKDCLDARLLSLFAKALNTSFQISEAPDRQYGMQKNGRFTGITGQLQREEADMGGSMGPLAERIPAMEFLWVIEADLLAIVSLKPTLSPQLLSLSKPFTEKRPYLVLIIACHYVCLFHGYKRVTVTKGLEKVKAGGYSFMSIKHGTKMTIDSLYSDIYGQTPYYLGHGVIQILAGFGWGFRFIQLMVRLQDAGIVSRLMKEVFEQRVRENKAAAKLNPQAITSITPYEEESRVVLGMSHLQGAFYMLLLGTGVAFLTLLGENLAHWCSSPQFSVQVNVNYRRTMLLEICLAVSASTVINTAPVAGQDVGKTAEQVGVDVGVMVGQVVEDYLSGCHLVLITTAPHSLITSNILRHLCESGEARVVVGAGWMFSQDHLLPGLWGDARTTCRGLILDLTYTNSTDLVLRFLEEAELWKLPETLVLVVGGKAGVMEVLLHHSLHNTIHALYLALHDLTIHHLTLETLPLHTPLRNLRHRKPVAQVSGGVWVYRRCLYCNSGEADVQLLHLWNLTSVTQISNDLFQEQFLNFWNTKMQFSTLVNIAYTDYKADSDEPGSTVTLKNGLDARLLFLFAERLNISFEIREQPERSYGMQKNGSFTGMVGQLQREEIDISGPMVTIAERIPYMDFLSYNRVDPLTIVSLRPTLLPQLLSLSKPLSRELWLSLLACVTVWGVILWLLQKVWWWLTGKRGVNFVSILLYGWGALLANLPSDPSVNKAGKVLVGVWLMFCLVITTGYTSSLVAHLSVQGKTKPPETFEDLVTLKNWKWGAETRVLTGAVLLYFSQHTDPVIQKVYKEMDVSI